MPKAMTLEDIAEVKKAFVATTKRALTAGFDVIEIHNAHGYLLHNFVSTISNRRTDQYGGSFKNRIRLTLEIVDLVRETIPASMPLFLCISATEWLDQGYFSGESWTIKDSVKLAGILAQRGVDLIDVSSGGNHPDQKIKTGPGYQAKEIKKAVGDKMAEATVGSITTGKLANQLLEEGLDLAVAARMFLKNPGLVWAWAEELGVEIQMANQYQWGFGGRPGAPKKN